MTRTYKIYSLSHPATKEVRYIGATTAYLNQRFSQHKHNALKKKLNVPISKWIYSLNEEGVLPIITLIEECNIDTWREREKYWINHYNNLTNIRAGGSGLILDRNDDGKSRTVAAHKKAVVLLDKEYNFIKEFDSCGICSEYLKIGRTAVCNALHGNGSVAKGYVVLYKKDYELNNYTKDYRGLYKTVYQYDFNGILLNKFNSVNEAFVTTNPSKYVSGLFESIKLEGRCGNYFFSFEEIKDFTSRQKKLKYRHKN